MHRACAAPAIDGLTKRSERIREEVRQDCQKEIRKQGCRMYGRLVAKRLRSEVKGRKTTETRSGAALSKCNAQFRALTLADPGDPGEARPARLLGRAKGRQIGVRHGGPASHGSGASHTEPGGRGVLLPSAPQDEVGPSA